MNVTSGCMAAMPYGYQPSIKGPYVAAEVIISLLAIVGNFLVCLAVTCNRRLRTVTNYFLVSLSVADILVGLLAIPCAVLTLCVLLLSILMVLTQSSILSLLAVAAERYVAILHPFQYQRVMSPRNARLALLLTWILALLSGSVPLMDWHKQSPNSDFCIFTCVVDMAFLVYFNFIVCLLVPLAIMFFIYGHIFVTVRYQLRRIAMARGSATPAEAGTRQAAGNGDTGGMGTEDTVDERSATGGTARESIDLRTEKLTDRDAEESPPKADTSSVVVLGRSVDWIGVGAINLSGDEVAAPQTTGPEAGLAAGPEASSRTEDRLEDTEKKTTTTFKLKPGLGVGFPGFSGSGSGGSNTNPAARTRKELRTATSLFLVLFQFMVCWMPVHCINCVLLLSPHTQVPMSVTLGAILLPHANSALNPLLYAYRMRSFRHALKGMCTRNVWPRYC